MLGRIPLLELILQIGSHGVEILLDTAVHTFALDDHLAEIVVEDVSHHANGHIRFTLQQLRTLAMQELVTLGADTLPLADQAFQILGDGLLGGTLGGGTDDHAHILRGDLRDNALETGTFTLAELAAHAGHAAGRHKHQETAGQRDL